MKNEIAGDPISGMRWTRKATKKISAELLSLGIRVNPRTVGRLLKKMKFSLKTNRKNIISGGKRKPGYRRKRNRQFLNMNEIRTQCANSGVPIISVDTKKKEDLGNFKNKGSTWCREASEVHDHDFKSDANGKAVPYGIYDVTKNRGHVIVGKSRDTPAFATDAIEEWWRTDGRRQYPTAKKLLILADCGGSNGARSRVWKKDIQEKLCNKHKIKITVCHYPPGSSKWNPIEHRLFSQISRNWAGVPLKDYDTVLNYVRTTTTSTGLKVKASLNNKTYEKGEKVSNDDFEKINCKHADTLPEWNYTIAPLK